MKRHFRKLGIGLCVLLTAVLIGCQAVGGFDLNQAIMSQLDVTSQEQSGSVELAIDWNEAEMEGMAPEFAPFMDMFSKVDFRIEKSATDGQGHQMVTGSLGFAGKSPIGFTYIQDGLKFRLDVDGAKRPLVIDLAEMAEQEGEPLPDVNLLMDQETQQQFRELLRPVAAYFVKHLPNPNQVEVSRVFSDVNGDNVAMTKVHAELDGEQLGGLVETYVDELVKDEAGFRQMLNDVVAWMTELPPELIQGLDLGDEAMDIPSGEELQSAVDEGVQQLYPMLQQLQTEIADMKEQSEWSTVFDKGITFNTDIYLDDQLHLRKLDTETVLEPGIFRVPGSPVRSITIRTHDEMWNVNGRPEIPPVEKPLNAIGPEQIADLSSVQFVRLFEDDSVIHEFLKNDLKIDDADFELGGWYDDGMLPYVVGEGSSEMLYVSLRQALDGFEDRVSFTPKTGELRFYDPGTWQEIVLHVGSSEAMVNGEKVEFSGPVEFQHGYTFVPADDLFRLLQAEYEYEKDEDGYITVKVHRDL